MADISMCSGIGCKIRNMCERFTANPSKPLQSYITPPVKEDGRTCGMFRTNGIIEKPKASRDV
jgi:hypothetical protein